MDPNVTFDNKEQLTAYIKNNVVKNANRSISEQVMNNILNGLANLNPTEDSDAEASQDVFLNPQNT